MKRYLIIFISLSFIFYVSCMNAKKNKEQTTIEYYNAHAEEWSASHDPQSKNSFWMPEIDQLHRYIPTGSIIDIGCGGAGEAAELIKRGYEYTGIDAAEKLINIAQKKFPEGQFLQMNILELDLPADSFDAFWCSAVLLHVPPEKISIALQNMRRVLKPGGVGFISLATGQGEFYDKDTGRYFYLYSEDDMKSFLEVNGFAIEKSYIKNKDTSREWLRTWLCFFVRAI